MYGLTAVLHLLESVASFCYVALVVTLLAVIPGKVMLVRSVSSQPSCDSLSFGSRHRSDSSARSDHYEAAFPPLPLSFLPLLFLRSLESFPDRFIRSVMSSSFFLSLFSFRFSWELLPDLSMSLSSLSRGSLYWLAPDDFFCPWPLFVMIVEMSLATIRVTRWLKCYQLSQRSKEIKSLWSADISTKAVLKVRKTISLSAWERLYISV